MCSSVQVSSGKALVGKWSTLIVSQLGNNYGGVQLYLNYILHTKKPALQQPCSSNSLALKLNFRTQHSLRG